MRPAILAAAVVAVAMGGYAAYSANSDVHHWIDARLGIASAQPKLTRKRRPPAPVRISKTTRRDIPIVLDGVGNVQAVSTVQIKSRIDGQVVEATVQDGQTVKKGSVLFRLDDRPLLALLRQAEANLGRDKANLEKAKSDVARYRTLSTKGISPVTKFEEAQSSLAALEAAIRASQAAVDIARLSLEYATIKAPISGRVGSVLISAGNMIKANDTQPMLVITQIKPVNVVFTLPEKYVAELRTRLESGQRPEVVVSVPGGKGPPEHGKLFFFNNVVDTTSGTIQVMARFDNKDERLMPGQFAQARVTLQVMRGAVVAPARAIQINQKGYYAWVLKPDQTVEARPVKIGPRVAGEIVVRSGLGPGETIITDGQLRLFPGATVKPIGDRAKGRKTKKVQS
jgi:membrane fusion protein, multidrug efflux system